MPALRLAFNALRRDLRAGELTLLLLALLLAVASLTSVAFFSDRLSRAVTRDANQLLGGDVLLSADHPWAPAIGREGRRRGLAEASTLLFTSMVSTDEQAQLAGVKAVSAEYPLRGQLRIADGPALPERVAQKGPRPGEVWLDERLFGALGVKRGDKVGVGNLQLVVSAMLTFESDRGANFFAFAPRLVMSLEDMPRSGLEQEGSRITYRQHLAGEPQAVRDFERWIQPRLGRGESLESINQARPELRGMIDRAHRFLSLAALLAVVLSAVAVGMATRRFVQRHLDGCAAMRCFGATQARLLTLFLGEFLLLGVLAAVLGALGGLVLHLAIERALAGLIATTLPPPTFWPAFQGALASLLLLVGFALPQLLRLGRVSTLRVLRREWPAWQPLGWSAWLAGGLALAALMVWVAGDFKLGAYVVGGFALALLAYGVLARAGIALLARTRGMAGASGGGWRYGLAALGRRSGSATVQAVALALGITAMLLLSVGLADLLDGWRAKAPPGAPNRFIANIQPDQREALRGLFEKAGVEDPDVLPMIRGRLLAVNGQPVKLDAMKDERARRLAEREFNLSYASRLQAGNHVVAGRWHGDDPQPAWSVEEGIARQLGVKLGDRLRFDVAGTQVEAPVTSLRKLEWDSMRVNFYVVASRGVLEPLPASYITSFHLPPEKGALTIAIARELPNLSVIDVSALLKQVQDTMDTLIRAVQLVFGLALAAGVLVMAAALQATHDERAHELAVLRTLGARNRQLRGALLAEFAALGLLAGVMGAAGALAIAAAVAQGVFDFSFSPSWSRFALGALVGMLGVMLAGVGGTRSVLRRPPLESLRALA
ncbi:FtsX-like permease family protein [Niveibacterium sp. SC-1]|uniref:ABC transporter permease n=1 Tax=Niveibacterium sp. SC-1 TaxID=3135646 RepID=UPI00311F4D4F